MWWGGGGEAWKTATAQGVLIKELRVRQAFPQIPITTQWSRRYYRPHFLDEETEAQRELSQGCTSNK